MNFSIIQAQTGVAFRLEKGHQLIVRAKRGKQVADLFCFSEQRPLDALSSGRSIDYNDTFLFTKDHVLYSNSGIAMLKIIEDTCGRNDFLVTPCSEQMFQMLNKDEKSYPNCQQNLWNAFTKFDRPRELVTTTFNIFMSYKISDSGKMQLLEPANGPSDYVTFQAMESLIVGLTACSDPGTNAGECKPVEFAVM